MVNPLELGLVVTTASMTGENIDLETRYRIEKTVTLMKSESYPGYLKSREYHCHISKSDERIWLYICDPIRYFEKIGTSKIETACNEEVDVCKPYFGDTFNLMYAGGEYYSDLTSKTTTVTTCTKMSREMPEIPGITISGISCKEPC